MKNPAVIETMTETVAKVPTFVQSSTIPVGAVPSDKMNLEEGPKFHRKQVEAGVRLILQGLSIDALDPNFVDTPKRVTRSFREFCLGLYESKKKMEDILGKTFPCDKNELVVVGPVRSVGLCPHHLLPVTIITWFGYLPDNKVVGLSKIPRMIKLLSAKPVLQESLTSEIVDKFLAYTKALGAGVIVEAKHSCMTSRGVHEHDSSVMTAAVRGLFEENSSLKEEFYRLVEMKKEDPMR